MDLDELFATPTAITQSQRQATTTVTSQFDDFSAYARPATTPAPFTPGARREFARPLNPEGAPLFNRTSRSGNPEPRRPNNRRARGHDADDDDDDSSATSTGQKRRARPAITADVGTDDAFHGPSAPRRPFANVDAQPSRWESYLPQQSEAEQQATVDAALSSYVARAMASHRRNEQRREQLAQAEQLANASPEYLDLLGAFESFGLTDDTTMFEPLTTMFDGLSLQFDARQEEVNASRCFERSMQYTAKVYGAIRLENIRRNLLGFRTPDGKVMLPTDVQMEIIEEILACSAPLIFEDEYDANPAVICSRYGWSTTTGIMSILMPRKWGKSSLIAMCIVAIMMEIPSFNHLNVSVTVDQGQLITGMIAALVVDHVRVKNGDFTAKISRHRVSLFSHDKNERTSECRASSVRNNWSHAHHHPLLHRFLTFIACGILLCRACAQGREKKGTQGGRRGMKVTVIHKGFFVQKVKEVAGNSLNVWTASAARMHWDSVYVRANWTLP
jgi:hypothetical protein